MKRTRELPNPRNLGNKSSQTQTTRLRRLAQNSLVLVIRVQARLDSELICPWSSCKAKEKKIKDKHGVPPTKRLFLASPKLDSCSKNKVRAGKSSGGENPKGGQYPPKLESLGG